MHCPSPLSAGLRCPEVPGTSCSIPQPHKPSTRPRTPNLIGLSFGVPWAPNLVGVSFGRLCHPNGGGCLCLYPCSCIALHFPALRCPTFCPGLPFPTPFLGCCCCFLLQGSPLFCITPAQMDNLDGQLDQDHRITPKSTSGTRIDNPRGVQVDNPNRQSERPQAPKSPQAQARTHNAFRNVALANRPPTYRTWNVE